jgi:hypothetical protein
MDTQPEDDDVLMALDPLEVVEHVLSAENLPSTARKTATWPSP